MGKHYQPRKWKTRPISRTCEVFMSQNGLSDPCRKPTVAAYQAMGGGWQALCASHSSNHLAIAKPIEQLLADGETLAYVGG